MWWRDKVIKNSLIKIKLTNIMYSTELLGAKAFWGPRLGISQPFLYPNVDLSKFGFTENYKDLLEK